MTTTPPDAPTGDPAGSPSDAPYEGGPRATRDEIRDLGRLRRSATDRKVAGVAGGLARHLDIDPVILRVAFVVLVFFGGAGLILYGACWLLVPEEGRESAPLGLDDRSRSIALIIVGALAAAAMIGDSWGGFSFPWPLLVIALVALLFLTRGRNAGSPPAPGTPGQVPPATTYGAPTYSPAYSPAAGAAAPAAQATTTQPAFRPPVYATVPIRPRNPRKRGPILFWFTLALIALAEGVLGIADLAGAPVADSAYPALAVGTTGLMLLVGAFYGRAGGLILVGLCSTLVLAGATAAGEWDGTTVHAAPASSVAVADDYTISTGELVLDLRDVGDLTALDGRVLHLSADIGHIEVIVPPGIDTRVDARIHGPGNIRLFGRETGGIDVQMSQLHSGGVDVPQITIDAELSVGQIEVHQ
jgi:phage shock protein PspC (stress-responsive transcriptional regulator)